MTNTNEAVLWMSNTGMVDARGWSDTMTEVAATVPELAEVVREREMAYFIAEDKAAPAH